MEKILFIIYLFVLLLNLIESSHIFPIKKIIFTANIQKLYDKTTIQWDFESKGYGILFNKESNISLIPYNLFDDILNYLRADEYLVTRIEKYENGTQEIILIANFESVEYETTHFILENSGISIPFKYFYVNKNIDQSYGIVFKTRENQEYIEFGKDLINAMNIEFKDEKNFVINNKEFITKIDDE